MGYRNIGKTNPISSPYSPSSYHSIAMRTVCTATYSPDWYRQQIQTHQLQLVAATPQAAKTVRLPYQPYYTLERLAQKRLSRVGKAIAPPLIAHQALCLAIEQVYNCSDIPGTARAMMPTVRDLLRSGGDLQLDSGQAFETNAVDMPSCVSLVPAYQQQLHANGWVDQAEQFWQACQQENQTFHVGAFGETPLFIYGYFYLTPDQLAFVDAIAGDGSILVLPSGDADWFADNRDALAQLQQQGWQVESEPATSATPNLGTRLQEKFLGNSSPPAEVPCYAYPHLEAEVRGIMGKVKSLLRRGVLARDIAIVARNDAFYGDTILDIATEYQVPVRALYAVPLSETRLGAWMQDLLQAIDQDFPFELTARVLRHPLAGRLSPDEWQQVRQFHPQGISQWQKAGVDLSLLATNERDTYENWVSRLQQILTDWQIRQRAARWAREIVAFYQWKEALALLQKRRENIVVSRAEFIEEAIATLNLTTVPAQPGRGGVALHNPISLFGAQYQHIFVVGMASRLLPQPIQDDPMLDFCDRKWLRQQGIPINTAPQYARQEAFAFYNLLGTATESLTFSYPKLISQENYDPSPYLESLEISPSEPPPLAIASWETARRIALQNQQLVQKLSKRDRILPTIQHAWEVEKQRESTAPYNEYDGAIQISIDPNRRKFSASQLTQIGHCPFQWFASRLLKLEELTEADTELSYSLKGKLYHKVLEKFAQRVLSEIEKETLETTLETAFDEAEKDEKIAAEIAAVEGWQARRQEHLNTLRHAISQTDFLPPGATIQDTEKRFEGTWHDLQITGYIDRIDSTKDGLRIVDYKTASNPPKGIKDQQGQLKIDIQLPLYAQVAAPSLFPNQPVAATVYYSLTKGKIFNKTKKATAQEDIAHFAEKVKYYLQAGYYPVNPDRKQEACEQCSFDLVCRRGNRLARKTEET